MSRSCTSSWEVHEDDPDECITVDRFTAYEEATFLVLERAYANG